MQPGPGWQNPIVAPPGQMQYGVDPLRLLPSRRSLKASRLQIQIDLRQAGKARFTPIIVTEGGVIWDGHHAIRLAALEGRLVDVLVTDRQATARATSILALSLR